MSDPGYGSLSTKSVRMEALAVLPVFFKLGGKRAMLAGGSAPAVWKAELLSACGADVAVYAQAPCAEMVTLASDPPNGPIRLVDRAWQEADLAGVALAIGAIEDEDEAESFRLAARRAGVPVNVIDKPAFCDFQFGTIVGRSPLVIGISTDGAAPVFGQAIRARIEALLPQGLKRWAVAARDWRPAVQALNLDFRARRRFWEIFTDRALARADSEPEATDLAELMEDAKADRDGNDQGLVILVGAGPGDPDLMTLSAIRALQTADIVVYGPDVHATSVGFARREAHKISAASLVSETGSEAAVINLVKARQRLVWLDSGDPDRCLQWQGRLTRLVQAGLVVEARAGLGLCSTCTPACSAWMR